MQSGPMSLSRYSSSDFIAYTSFDFLSATLAISPFLNRPSFFRISTSRTSFLI